MRKYRLLLTHLGDLAFEHPQSVEDDAADENRCEHLTDPVAEALRFLCEIEDTYFKLL